MAAGPLSTSEWSRPTKIPFVLMGRKGVQAPFVVPPKFRVPRHCGRTHAFVMGQITVADRGTLPPARSATAGLGSRARGGYSPMRWPRAALSRWPPLAVGACQLLVPFKAHASYTSLCSIPYGERSRKYGAVVTVRGMLLGLPDSVILLLQCRCHRSRPQVWRMDRHAR